MDEFNSRRVDWSGRLRLLTAGTDRYKKVLFLVELKSLFLLITAFLVVLDINKINILYNYACLARFFLDTPCLKCIVSVIVIGCNVLISWVKFH